MNLKEDEKEQLLQDASTLLMFANVAAKQQQNQQRFSPPPPSMPGAVNENSGKEIRPGAIENYGNRTTAYVAHEEQRSGNPHPVLFSVPNEYYNKEQVMKSPVTSSGLQGILHQSPSAPLIPENEKAERAQQTQVERRLTPAPITAAETENNGLTELGPPLRVKSAQPTVGFKDEISTDIKHTHSSESNSISGTPKSSQSTGTASSHKRSASNPEQSSTTVNRFHNSPGPANVTLAGGINRQNGVRDNNNAMIAAAALAAAADIPLPLKQVASETKKLKDEEDQGTEPEDDNKTEDEEAKKPAIKTLNKEDVMPEATNDTVERVAPSKQTPHLDSYKVDPDSGIIGCICDIDEDDGFTVQCDVCFRWQHCVCMGFETSDEVPEDEYRCYFCDASKMSKLDPETCRTNTVNRLKTEDTADDRRGGGRSNNERNPKRKQSTNKVEKLEKRKKSKGNLRLRRDSAENIFELLPDKLNVLLDDGISAEDYSSVYYKIRTNRFKSDDVEHLILGLVNQSTTSNNKLSNDSNEQNFGLMTETETDNINFSKLILPNQEKYLEEHQDFKKQETPHNSTTIKVKSYNENQKSKFSGISKLGLFISTENRSMNNEEVVIPKGTSIIEYLGEIDSFQHYVEDPINQYGVLGVTKPKVLKRTLRSPSQNVDVVVDSRFVGNESRFIRRSCPSAANCEIKHYFSPSENRIKFIVFTSKEIKLDMNNGFEDELRLSWEWDPNHPILKFYEDESMKFDSLPSIDKSLLITNIDELLYFNDCGCSTVPGANNCAIFKVKKATSYLMRSNRKISSISNVNLFKPKEDLISPKKPKEYIPWSERVRNRDANIEMKLSVTAKSVSSEISVESISKTESKSSTKSLSEVPSSKISFKKQYMIKNVTRQISNGNTDYPSPSVLPIPVVPELLVKIENSIKEKVTSSCPKIEEIENISKDSIKVDLEHEKKVDLQKQKSDDISLTSKPTISQGANNTEGPPIVKKKLSFADYKKKMK